VSVVAKLRELPLAAKIAIAATLAAIALAALYFGSRYAAGAAGAGVLGVVGTMFGKRRNPPGALTDSAAELAAANTKRAEAAADRARAEANATARQRAAAREAESRRRAVAAGVDDGDDPNRVLDRHSAGPGIDRDD